MAIDAQKLVFTARELLTELPESVHFSRENLHALIPPAIQVWQEQVNDNPAKRDNFIVESAPITITGGVADIATEVDSKGFLIHFIRESDIVIAYDNPPFFTVKFVNSRDRLYSKGRQDRFYVLAWLNGTLIEFKDADEVSPGGMNGSFTLRGVVLPSDLSEVPGSSLAELALIIADLAKAQVKGQNRGLDITPQ